MNFYFKKGISLLIFVIFFLYSIIPPSYSQNLPNLPAPGTIVSLSPSFTPTIISGITIYPDNPFKFDFIIEQGDSKLKDYEFKQESIKLIKYFLASLTTPEEKMWVNLSPYEKDRIIADGFDTTEMGRDLLAQDYILKQLTASLMYPENELGKEFWNKIYAQAKEKLGINEIPMNTFNKVWIIPDRASVYVHDSSVFVVDSHLKVMLEEDYAALNHQISTNGHPKIEDKQMPERMKNVLKDIIIPEIEKEVNEGKNFSQLRQIYNSLILATWYKKNLKQSLLGRVYVDKNRTKGVDVEDKQIKQKIYDQYLEAFKKGAYDFIKEDYDPDTQQVILRKYFSGGVAFSDEDMDRAMSVETNLSKVMLAKAAGKTKGTMQTVSVVLDSVRNLDHLRRLLNVLAQSDQVPQLQKDASEDKILEFILDHLESRGLIKEIRSESSDVKVFVIKDEVKNSELGKAIKKWVMDPLRGIKAINFKGTDGVWKIVGFKSEIDAQLDLEREEVRERKKGKHWIEAFNNARERLGDPNHLIEKDEAQKRYEVARRDILSASNNLNRKPVILLTGMPASGKGTVGNMLSEELFLPNISLGEILRKMWDKDSSVPKTPELGAQKLIEEILSNPEKYNQGFILDSNPISIESQNMLEKVLAEKGYYIVKVVNVVVHREMAKQRFRDRPPREGDRPGEDQGERFERRMNQHEEVTEELVRILNEQGRAINIDNSGELDETKRRIKEIVPILNLARIMEIVKDRGWNENEVKDKYIPLVKNLIKLQEVHSDKRLVVGVSGIGGSGKTALSELLNVIAQTIKGRLYSAVLSQDDFFMTKDELKEAGIEEWTPEAVNIKDLQEQIELFKEGSDISKPILSKIDKKSQSQNFERVRRETFHVNNILFIEGIDILNRNSSDHESLFNKLDFNIQVGAEVNQIKEWWINRESQKYPTRTRIQHEQKWKERITKEKRSDGSLNLIERDGLWINADIFIEKGENHQLKGLYYRSLFSKGNSITKINEIAVNPIRAVEKSIEKLESKIFRSNLNDDQRNKTKKIINILKKIYRNFGIGWIDVLAKNEEDYVLGFADKKRQQIGLAPEFFKENGTFVEDLEQALFYFGYMLAFPSRYQAVDGNFWILNQEIFESNEIISKNKIKEFVKFSARPKKVLFSPMSDVQVERLGQLEGKGSLQIAKQLVERISQDNGGKMPSVAFLTPTGKGGGVSVLVKDIAEVLFSNEVGIKGQWISAVRHENIDYWGASGKFQQALGGTSNNMTPEDLEKLNKAMRDNVEAMNLEGVDYLFLHEPYTLGMIPLIRKKYPNIKIIWFVHGDLSHSEEKARELMRRYLTDSDAMIYSWMKDYIPEGGVGSPGIFMIHGINQENAKNMPLSDKFINAVAEKYKIDRNRPVLLHVGRFNLTKDPLRSIAAYLKVKEKLRNQPQGIENKFPQLVITGIPLAPSDWRLYKELHKFVESLNDPDIHIIASDNVMTEFTENQILALKDSDVNIEGLDSWDRSDLELNALQRLSTVGIHPALTEGFGLVISEALIKGTPVVASNVGGIPTQITDKRFLVNLSHNPFVGVKDKYDRLKSPNGRYLDLLNLMNSDSFADEFADRILVVLNMNNSEKRAIVDNNQQFISSEYSILRSITGHLELIEVLGLIEVIKNNKGGDRQLLENAMVRLSKVDQEFIPIIVRQLKYNDFEVQELLIEVLKRMNDGSLISLLEDMQFMEQYDEADFNILFKRMKKIVQSYSKDYVPVIIKYLDKPNDKAQRNLITLLTLFGEDIIPDLIREFKISSTRPYLKRGIIEVLTEIGVMGDENVRLTLQNYLHEVGVASDKDSVIQNGYTYDESLGKIASTISRLNYIPSGEKIAGLLMNNGIYPTESFVKVIADGQTKLEDIINRFKEIREKQNFDKNNLIDLSLGYSLLRVDSNKQNSKFDLTYDEYLLWVKGEQVPPILGKASSIEQKHLDEISYLASEAYNLEKEILLTAERARKLNRPFIVIGNNTYGGQIALAPIIDSLKGQNIKVLYTKVPSGYAHLNPFYIPYNIFNESDLEVILREKPILFVVDGTNSLRGTVLEGKLRRDRQPHYPDSYQGFRNYFLALNEALGQTIDPLDFHISEEMYLKLRQTSQFGRLVEYLRKIKLKEGLGDEKNKGYKFSFWNASQKPLPIRVERELIENPISVDVDKISGPEIVFAQSVMDSDEIPSKEETSQHIPGYFDISLQESGNRNFDFELYNDESGPHLRSVRDKNIELLKSLMNKLRWESLISKGQIVLDYFGRAKTQVESIKNPGAILLLGNHEIKTALSFIEYYKKLLIKGDSPSIVISGGIGRGTQFLRARIKEYFDERNESLPIDFMKMNEAQLNKIFLIINGIPEDKIYLEEKATNSFENFIFSKSILERLIKEDKILRGTELAIFQTPTQTLRAQDIAEEVLKDVGFEKIQTVEPYKLNLSDANELEAVVTLFRLVGLRAIHIEGEVPIFDEFNKKAAKQIPVQIRNVFHELEQEFSDYLDLNPKFFGYIQGFFSSTFISRNEIEDLIVAGGDEIRQFLQDLTPYVEDPLNSPYSDIAHIDQLWKAVRKYKVDPSNYDNQALITNASNVIPRVAVRQLEETGGAAQVSIIGIPGQYRKAIVKRIVSQGNDVLIKESGSMSIDVTKKGVDKSLPIEYVDQNLNDLLDKMGYAPGNSIDVRKTKTIIFSDGDNTLYSKPLKDRVPNFIESETRQAFIDYLKEGGVFVLITGADMKRTLERMLSDNGIPQELRRRVLIFANGGSSGVYFDFEGKPKRLDGYKYGALTKRGSDLVKNIDAIYIGDEIDSEGNDFPVISKVGNERFISVSDKKREEIPDVLRNSHIGFNQLGAKAFLEAVVEHSQKFRFLELFTEQNLNSNSPNSLIKGALDKIKILSGEDSAMLGQDVGGIDLNPNRLDLQTQGDGIKFEIPINIQAVQAIQIDGFIPVIIQVVPTNLPLLLGFSNDILDEQLSRKY